MFSTKVTSKHNVKSTYKSKLFYSSLFKIPTNESLTVQNLLYPKISVAFFELNSE